MALIKSLKFIQTIIGICFCGGSSIMRSWATSVLVPALVISLSGCGGDCLTLGGCGDSASAASGAASDSTTSSGSGGTSSTALFEKSGTGDTVFRLPTNVSVVQISARYTGSSSWFDVRVAGDRKVLVLLGTSKDSTTYDGRVTVTPGSLVEITDSSGVVWTFREVRL